MPQLPHARLPLTPRQRSVYDFIVASLVERCLPPTHRMIGEHFGITGTNGVASHLRPLVKKGWLVRVRGEGKYHHYLPVGTVVTVRPFVDPGTAPDVYAARRRRLAGPRLLV